MPQEPVRIICNTPLQAVAAAQAVGINPRHCQPITKIEQLRGYARGLRVHRVGLQGSPEFEEELAALVKRKQITLVYGL